MRSDTLSVPVSSQSLFIVEKKEEVEGNDGNSWKKVASTLFPNTNPANVLESAPYNLYFDTGTVAPISMSLYRVRKDETKTLSETGFSGIQSASSIHRSLRNTHGLKKKETDRKNSFTLQNDMIGIEFEM